MSPNNEPVAITSALTVLFGAVIALLSVFKITHWTAGEVTAVMAVWSGFIGFVLVVWVRAVVTPVANPKTTVPLQPPIQNQGP
jgi:LDH2 family malate/lactate/ureidoglycolate dehydrogenase